MNPHDRIDDYVDDALDAADRARFEQAMAADPALRRAVEETRAVVAGLRSLPEQRAPSRDLWPEVQRGLGAGRRGRRLAWGLGAGAVAGGAVAAAALLTVGTVAWLAWSQGPAVDVEARVAAMEPLREGDLPTAADALVRVAEANTGDVEAQVAAAYGYLLRGDHAAADAMLVDALDEATDEQRPGLLLRRAVLARRSGQLDRARDLGEQSGLPAGQVLAAEVYLADAEADEAVRLLEQARGSDDPRVSRTARTYLEYLGDRDSGRAQLAEAAALWALDQRAEAVETAEELLVFLPTELEGRDATLLLWAGRAASSGRPDVADALLDDLLAPPDGQAWRVVATRAIASAARGDLLEAEDAFRDLEVGGAPLDGVRDARLTAAAVSPDVEARRRLVGSLDGPVAALLLSDPGRAEGTLVAAWLEGR